jgi:3-hydroxy-9,10-secoandrosta-1,3,5(10)-triene-9,17-dione monooxygenase reductase component
MENSTPARPGPAAGGGGAILEVMTEPADDGWARHGGEDPFATPEPERDPLRRLRGRLTSPVTVWTAWDEHRRAVGVTVSSTVVGEGEPPHLFGLLGPLTEVWEAIEATGTWVVHLLSREQIRLADQMAGRYPDDPFRGVVITETAAGPVIGEAPTRVVCRLVDGREQGRSVLVTGRIDSIELGPSERPLVHYRSGYYSLAPRKDPEA